MKIIPTIILLAFLTMPVQAQNLSGIRIGDDASVTERLGGIPIARESSGPFEILKYRFADGNELSITLERGTRKIVYVESDWGGKAAGAYSDYPGFIFGKTTLMDIRKKMGSNGMGFSERPMVSQIPNGVIMLNTYDISGVLVTFITKVSGSDLKLVQQKQKEISIAAKLDAIIITSNEYAAVAWGKQQRDPAYRPGVWK